MATKFRFRLKAVQGIRERERDDRRRGVAESLINLQRAEQHTTQLGEQLRRTIELSVDERKAVQLDVPAQRGQLFYRSWLHGRLLDADAGLVERKAEFDRRRLELAEATARVKAIEKLRQRRWDRYRNKLQKEEQSINDEAAARIMLEQARRANLASG